jgi:hypothetical protein
MRSLNGGDFPPCSHGLLFTIPGLPAGLLGPGSEPEPPDGGFPAPDLLPEVVVPEPDEPPKPGWLGAGGLPPEPPDGALGDTADCDFPPLP